ncbi:hypothetical protein PP175_21515 [Aneurinibacillus sp. Ricciae_BoGa-3]|uniref:hypothetical protein n=1 Tax=Aneurinibacillus sp. Ricciae_BoGa-3 TaxID=3022697 RepID=UPI002340AB87|nr:hypothetical protein [Aneurinibacillus sp. Ricciae_BoGa-3]WCK53871.1 hypothetical protein PP175_21515 [Aneurinibacillus sp. Ricciae_BoGa-3]
MSVNFGTSYPPGVETLPFDPVGKLTRFGQKIADVADQVAEILSKRLAVNLPISERVFTRVLIDLVGINDAEEIGDRVYRHQVIQDTFDQYFAELEEIPETPYNPWYETGMSQSDFI